MDVRTKKLCSTFDLFLTLIPCMRSYDGDSRLSIPCVYMLGRNLHELFHKNLPIPLKFEAALIEDCVRLDTVDIWIGSIFP